MVKQTRETPPRPDWYGTSNKPCVCMNCQLTKLGMEGHPCLIPEYTHSPNSCVNGCVGNHRGASCMRPSTTEYTPSRPPKSFVPPTRRLDLPNAVQPKFDWPRDEREEVLHKEIARLHKEVEKGVKMGMLVGGFITLLMAYLIL